MSYLPTQGMGGANVAAFGMGGGSAPPTEVQRSGMIRLMLTEMILAEQEAEQVKKAEAVRKSVIKKKAKVERRKKKVEAKVVRLRKPKNVVDALEIFVAKTQKSIDHLTAEFERLETSVRESVSRRAEQDPSVWVKLENYQLKVMNEILGESRERRRRNQQRAIVLSSTLLAA